MRSDRHEYLSISAGAVFFAALILVVPCTDAQEPVIPEDYPLDRYESIWERSPFTLSSAAEEPTAGFASNLVLVGVGSIDDLYYARILDRASQERWSVEEGKPHEGIELVKVQSDADPSKASVRLKKGGEEAVVRFDQNLLAAMGAPPQGANQQQVVDAETQRERAAAARRARNTRRPNASPNNAAAQNQRSIPTPRRRRIIIPSRPNP